LITLGINKPPTLFPEKSRALTVAIETTPKHPAAFPLMTLDNTSRIIDFVWKPRNPLPSMMPTSYPRLVSSQNRHPLQY
jgi:ADP-glucose pyrophosphorylase